MGTLGLMQVSQAELQKQILHTWEEAGSTWEIPLHIGPINIEINKIIIFMWIGAARRVPGDRGRALRLRTQIPRWADGRRGNEVSPLHALPLRFPANAQHHR